MKKAVRGRPSGRGLWRCAPGRSGRAARFRGRTGRTNPVRSASGAAPGAAGRLGFSRMRRFPRILRAVFAALLALTAWVLPLRASAEDLIAASASAGYGVCVLDAGSGRVLYAEHPDARLRMASTTKIMTALLALEAPGIDEPFCVGPEVASEGTQVGLKPGDAVTLRTLAACMLLESGNDAANAAAARVGGSVRRFIDRMNLRAEELGLHDTAFRTPSGLDADPHYTTAYDLACLAAHALENPDFAALCAQKSLVVSFGTPAREVTLYNHNRLLSEYEGCIGVKTGFTKRAGRCLVSAAERDGRTLVCVTLNVYGDWEAHKALLDRCFTEYVWQDAGIPGTVPVTNGEPARLCPLQIPVREGETFDAVLRLRPFLYEQPEPGEQVGEALITLPRETLTLPIKCSGGGESAAAQTPTAVGGRRPPLG